MLRAGLLVLALGLGGAAHVLGEKAGEARNAEADPDQLMYLPEGSVLRLAGFGHRNLLADIVWIRAIQYYGEQRLSGRNYDEAERLFQVIYDLDNTFKGATRFGALILSQDAGNPRGALALLERAIRDHPEDWEYRFDAGFIHQTILRDYQAAGDSYRAASKLPGAPPVAARLAGLSFARLGDRASSREVWWAILDEADNELVRQVAERNLRNLDMEDAQETLTLAAAAFRTDSGRLPTDWNEVIRAGHLSAVPEEPFGGQYFLDPGTGEVWATTIVDRRMGEARDMFARCVRQLREADGRWPESLGEVVDRGLQRFPPWAPFGITLDYDPADGTVSWNPPWPATEPRKQGAATT